MGGVEHEVAREAMRLAAAKLPVRTRFLATVEPQVAHAGSAEQ